jgi:hypothetical protein
VIVHGLTVAHRFRIQVTKFHRENELQLEIGTQQVSPDFHLQCLHAGKIFNILFELDRGTEPLDSQAATSVRRKIESYDAYQDHVLQIWRRGGRVGTRPGFRVAFLTESIERAYHVLSLAAASSVNPDRRLILAAASESFLAESDAMRSPTFLDHRGHWRSLVDPHPTAQALRAPVRLAPFLRDSLPI